MGYSTPPLEASPALTSFWLSGLERPQERFQLQGIFIPQQARGGQGGAGGGGDRLVA